MCQCLSTSENKRVLWREKKKIKGDTNMFFLEIHTENIYPIILLCFEMFQTFLQSNDLNLLHTFWKRQRTIDRRHINACNDVSRFQTRKWTIVIQISRHAYFNLAHGSNLTVRVPVSSKYSRIFQWIAELRCVKTRKQLIERPPRLWEVENSQLSSHLARQTDLLDKDFKP